MSLSPVNSKKRLFTIQTLTAMAMFSAILCISAYISIPVPIPGSPHITLLNFIILLIALLFPVHQAFLTVLVWMFLGIIGAPVFIGGNAGYGYLLTGWGGYTLAFLLAAVIIPLIRGRKYNRLRYTFTAITGVLIINILGMIYLKVMTGITWEVALLTGFVSFLPLDILKAVVAVQIVPVFRQVLLTNN